MDINDLQFPDGIKLHFKFGETDAEKMGRKLSTSLEIPKDRYISLKNKITKIVLGALADKNTSYLQLDRMVDKAAKLCITIPELTFTMYALGTILEQEKAKQENKKKGNTSLGGFPGIIIAMGGMSKGNNPKQDDEDPIERAMRESKKINGDYNKRSYDDGEEG